MASRGTIRCSTGSRQGGPGILRSLSRPALFFSATQTLCQPRPSLPLRSKVSKRSRAGRIAAQPPTAASAAASAAATPVADDEPFFPTRALRIAKTIATFGLPAIMVPLADPIMSLIDTVALGQMAGSLQLAALGPCALILNFSFYSFAALSVATVSLVSERLRAGRGAEHALASALVLGAAGGAAVTVVLLTLGPRLLAATGCDPALLGTAWEYLRVRALAAPAAITTSVAQAGLLGQRDSRTPFKIVMVSIALSLLGDIVLIGGMGMGVVGAAWTTAAAQYASAALLLRALRSSRVVPPLEMPSRGELAALASTASTLGIFYVAKTTSYLFLQSAAARLPALLLAAHQPVWQLWGLASFSNTPLEQAALAFVPAATSPRDRRDWITVILSLGALSGLFCSLIAHGIPAVAPGLLTADPALWGPMQAVALPGTLALMACGLDVSSTGVLLARKDSGYVARSMILSGSALVGYLWWSGRAAAAAGTGGGAGALTAVWWALTVFFGVRTAQSLPRVWLKHMGEGEEGEGGGKAAPPSPEVADELNLGAA